MSEYENWVGRSWPIAGILLLRYLARNELPDEPEGQAQGFITDALAYVSGVLGISLGAG
ncbi:MAG: hypothetical protein QG597_3235 [Actinomycetota bacterium]|nr:hypothetical protein [Actinomycetota bacterium]